MENNIETPDFEQDDFDKIFADLISVSTGENEKTEEKKKTRMQRRQTNEIAVDGDRFALVPYMHEGVAYMIPKNLKEDYVFSRMELCVFRQNVPLEVGKTCIYENVEIEGYVSFFLSLKELDSTVMPSDEERVLVLLYREGEPQPLAGKFEYPLSDEYYCDFSTDLDELPPGKYFLLMRNVKCETNEKYFNRWKRHSRFEFTVLPKGEDLKHPVICSANVEKAALKNTNQQQLCAGDILVNLKADIFPDKMDEYTVCCFNQNLCMMGKNNVLYANGALPPINSISLAINSSFIWMPGDYFLIVKHNGEPFYRYDFALQNDKIIEKKGHLIKINDENYFLGKYLIERNSGWNGLGESMGTIAIKQKVLEHYSRNRINAMRKEHGLNQLEYNNHYIYTTDYDSGNNAILRCFSKIINEDYSCSSKDCATLVEPRNAVDPYEEVNNLLESCNDSTICLYNIGSLLAGGGKAVVQRFEKKLHQFKQWSLFLKGTEAEINQLLEANPTLARFFPSENRIEPQDANEQEIMHFLQLQLKRFSLHLLPETQDKLAKLFIKAHQEGMLSNWNEDYVIDFVRNGIMPRYQNRILRAKKAKDKNTKLHLSTIRPSDVDEHYILKGKYSFDESMLELNKMVGLTSVKQNMTTAFNRMWFNEQRQRMGLNIVLEDCHHMIFTGNPGTGKTTVAKMVGKIYRSLGVLSKGEVVVTERSQMVGRYIGDTEKNMQAVLNQARGNVLFIDEAYTLCDGGDDRKDFGMRAIECLLTVLAQKNPDMLVIMAGYDKEMAKMMETNPGLKGRFPHTFHFEDYSSQELLDIAEHIFSKEEYRLTAEAREKLLSTITETIAIKDSFFSNARWVEQYVRNGIMPAMANRIIKMAAPIDKNLFQQVEVEDVIAAFEKFNIRNRSAHQGRNRVGFRV